MAFQQLFAPPEMRRQTRPISHRANSQHQQTQHLLRLHNCKCASSWGEWTAHQQQRRAGFDDSSRPSPIFVTNMLDGCVALCQRASCDTPTVLWTEIPPLKSLKDHHQLNNGGTARTFRHCGRRRSRAAEMVCGQILLEEWHTNKNNNVMAHLWANS
uniref:Uncharacterized protein n=1 Tax=Globodera rostochiensis TaxID=31243 RepID=A0A914HXJ5_GLORO